MTVPTMIKADRTIGIAESLAQGHNRHDDNLC